MELRQNVLRYYLEHIQELPKHKQFHFATRTYAWLGLPEARQRLQAMRPDHLPSNDTSDGRVQMFTGMISHSFTTTPNAEALRAPYFAKYPQLRGIDYALFRARHLLAVYGVDMRPALRQAVDEHTLRDLETALLSDDQALRILSTYAINFLFLLHKVILSDDAIPREHLRDLGKAYSATDPTQLQLLMYLYTHCIIGESNFYTQEIPATHLPLYQSMLQVLEEQIEAHFTDINLDNKLEFWVCCRICKFDTKLAGRINDECERSVSDADTFIVDQHNTNGQEDRSTFEGSEHRNVLFIMSGSDYEPHSQPV